VRRVVVTGIGLICAVGNSTEEVWRNLLAGKSGVRRITQFDTTNHACKIAGEVRDFDPLNYIEKKEVKKMARFIHLAIAASDEAMKMSGLQVTPENAEMVGVHIGSGIGGFDIIEREHTALMEGGPRKISPFFYSGGDRESCCRTSLNALRSERSERSYGHSLHHKRALNR